MNMEKPVERELIGKTKLLREKFPQCHFVNHIYAFLLSDRRATLSLSVY
jgi:hypothetical protein